MTIEFDDTMRFFAREVASATSYYLVSVIGERFDSLEDLCKRVFNIVQFDVTEDRREFLEWVVWQTATTLGFSY